MLRQKRDYLLKRWLGSKRLLRRAVLAYETENYLHGLLIKDINGAIFSVDPNDNMVTRAMLHLGQWQYGELSNAINLFSSKTNGREAVFVDIGCHIGTQLVTAMKTKVFKRGFGFEMTPGTFKHLQRNILLNGLCDQVQVFNTAISSESKEWIFSEVYQNKGANHLRTLEQNKNTKIIQSKTLTDVFASIQFNPAEYAKLFWVDVEGMELDIVKGLFDILNDKTDALVFEFNPDAYEPDALKASLDFLFSKFSRAHSLTSNSDLSRQDILNIKKQIDILFL